MKKIGCLTFHASHNYGSALQTYALKKAVESMDSTFKYSVINLRSPNQDNLYKSIFEKRDMKSLYCRLFFLNQKKKLGIKCEKFEKFIEEEFNITAKYNEKTLDVSDFDFIICGSDQIWNVRACDFSWLYFLDFDAKAIKISYACSMGTRKIALTDCEQDKIKRLLSDFKYVSVRDENTEETLKEICDSNFDVSIDPTMLLTAIEWRNLAERSDCAKKEKKYIFFYDLSHNKENWKIAKRIGRILKLSVVISNVPYPRVVNESVGFVKQLDCGPVDFISLIENAEPVLTSSFHGTAFSVLFNIPFFVINGRDDMRISSFLSKVRLQERNISSADFVAKTKNYKDVCFKEANDVIAQERSCCLKKLKEALR